MNKYHFNLSLILIAMLVVSSTGAWAQLSAQLSNETSHRITVDVEQVIVPLTVVDKEGLPVTTLSAKHFRVYEDKIEQEIKLLGVESMPVSMGVVFDTSGSMEAKKDYAHTVLTQHLKLGNADDEFSLIAVSDKVNFNTDFSPDISKALSPLIALKPRGMTALYDAIYFGLEQVKSKGVNSRKALLLITDGFENNSRYTFNTVLDYARELEVQVYFIAFLSNEDLENMDSSMLESLDNIQKLVQQTGGFHFYPLNSTELMKSSQWVAQMIRNQYVLSYMSNNQSRDGKYRKIKVELNESAFEKKPKYTIRHKQGYNAPLN
jgi:Ca-activated chloride channel homolog